MFVYHERQLGALCGVHCVNNVLQGPRFGPGDLAEIGVRLDRKERKLLNGSEIDNENFDGGADGGNFSIQVLRIALARAGVKLLPAEHPDAHELMANPARLVDGFVVQRRDHWYTMRAVGACWWDLDSLLPQPRPLEESRLAPRLGRLISGGHSVFLVVGRLPEPIHSGGVVEPGGNWHAMHELTSPAVQARGSDTQPGPTEECLDGFADAEVRAALALSCGDMSLAAVVLCRARQSVAKRIHASPGRLARALTAAVESLLQARRSLPDAVARLVVLLCAPSPGALAAAAALVDCGDLAHRLLTALSRKAKGWLWTDGLAQAATIAVDLLLELPKAQPPADGSEDSDSSSSSSSAASIAELEETAELGGLAREGLKSKVQRNAEFNDLDSLLSAVEAEGRLIARPLVSEPGLRAQIPPPGCSLRSRPRPESVKGCGVSSTRLQRSGRPQRRQEPSNFATA